MCADYPPSRLKHCSTPVTLFREQRAQRVSHCGSMPKSIWASRVTAVELEGVTASPGSEPPSSSTPNITNLTNHMPEANKPGPPVAPPKMLALPPPPPPMPPPPPSPPPPGAGESVSERASSSVDVGRHVSAQL